MREKQSYALPCLGDWQGRSKTTSCDKNQSLCYLDADLVYSVVGEPPVRRAKHEEIMKK